MTAVIGGISVFLEDDTARFQQSMARNAGLVEQQSQRMTRALGNTARSVDELNRRAGSFQPDAFRSLALSALHAENSVERLRTVMLAVTALATGSFAGAFGAKLLQDTADRYSDIQNKIAAVVPDVRARAGIEQQIYDTANRSLSAYEATAVLFQRLQLSASNLGGTQSEILRVVETTQKALKAGGATTQEAASAAVQLSQALGAGRLQGDELRSILENAPILAQAIAKEFGVAVGELKDLGSEGQLTSSRVFRAILNSSQTVDDKFAELKPTISQALVVLDNAFTRFLGQVDQSLGASNALAQGIISLSKNLSTLGDIAALVGPLVAGVFVSRAIRSAGGSVTAPYREEIQRRKEALAQAQALEQQTAERVVNAGSRTADLRTRARTDLESFADQGVRKNRDQVARDVAAGVEAVKKAQDEFQAVVQRTSGVDVAAVARSAEKVHASSELKGLREEVSDAQKQVKAAESDLAAANTAATRSVLSSREAERLTKLRQTRAELQEQIASADSRIASLQAEAAGLPDARAGSRTRTRSARADALDEEMAQRAAARNETGLAVYRATKEIAELEQRLAESTSAVRKKAADEAEKVGAALIKAEEAVVAQREVLAKREAASSGRDVAPEVARRRTDEQVLARIEQEIKAQERLDELVKRRDALAKQAVDLVDKQQVGAGSLGAGDVKKLNEARRERDFFTQQLADQDAQLDTLRAERDRLRSGIGPRSARNLERDAETNRQREAINAEIAQVEAARAEAMRRFEGTRGADGVDEKRLQLQERLNAALEREAATSGPITNRTAAQERLNKVLREDVELRNAIRDIDTTGADRIVEASQKVENAKRRVADADRTIRTEVAQRVSQERGTANSQIMSEISDAALNRRNAQGDLRTSQGLLEAAGDEVRANATANATRQIAQAQQQSAIAAAGYQRAQDAVAVATARTGAATTFLTTTLGLARTGFASLYGFLGGFWGVALTAATTGLALYEIAQARAAARTEEFKRATDAAAASVKALNEARTSGPAIQATALSAANQTLGTLQSGLQEALDNAMRAVPRTQAVQSVDEFGRATITSTNAQYDALARLGQKLDETRKQGGDTRGIIQQMIEEIDRLGSQSIDMAGVLGPLRELLGVALSGAEALRGLRAAANQAAAARGEFDDARDARLRAASRMSPEGARRADLNQQRLAAENSPDAMEKLGEYMNQYYEGRRKSQNNFTRAFEKETLTAKGDKVGARMTDLRSQYPGIDEAELKNLAELQEKNSKSGSKKKAAKSEEEKFEDRLKRLQEEGRAAFFNDTDRAVIEELKKIKGEPTLLRNTVDAIKNGQALPQQAQQVRDAILMKEAGKEYRSIIQSYGTLEQITPEVVNQQAKLNALLDAGKISADQYNLALADFMGKYKQFAWIDNLSDSLSSVSGELAEAALGFKKVDDVANSFLQTMLKFGLNEALVAPFKNMLKGFFAQAGAGGDFNPLSFISNAISGAAGASSFGATQYAALATNAAPGAYGPGFADGGQVRGPGGPTSDSIMAWLSDEEFVVKASAARKHLPLLEAINDGKLGPLLATAGRLPRFATGGSVGRVSQRAGSSLADMVGGGSMNVSIEPPAGHRANVEGRTSPKGPSARVTFEQMFAEDLTSNGPMAQALQGLYGVNRMTGRRS